MTKPGMARAIIIPMERELADFVVQNNLRLLGVDRKEFDELLDKVRGQKKPSRQKKSDDPN